MRAYGGSVAPCCSRPGNREEGRPQTFVELSHLAHLLPITDALAEVPKPLQSTGRGHAPDQPERFGGISARHVDLAEARVSMGGRQVEEIQGAAPDEGAAARRDPIVKRRDRLIGPVEYQPACTTMTRELGMVEPGDPPAPVDRTIGDDRRAVTGTQGERTCPT
jgi:hypothetical protein